MQSISNLIHDDPYLTMPPAERIALRRQRREKFRACELTSPVVRLERILPIPPDVDSVGLVPKHEKDVLSEWVKRQKEIPTHQSGGIAFKPLAKIVTGDIQRAVAAEFEVSWTIMFTASRQGRVVLPRQIAMYLVKTIIGTSLPEIGRRFGNRDHTTILSAVRKIEKMMKADACFAGGIERLRAAIMERRT